MSSLYTTWPGYTCLPLLGDLMCLPESLIHRFENLTDVQVRLEPNMLIKVLIILSLFFVPSVLPIIPVQLNLLIIPAKFNRMIIPQAVIRVVQHILAAGLLS